MLTNELVLLRSALRSAYADSFRRLAQVAGRLVPPDSPLAPLKHAVAERLRPTHRRRLDMLLSVFAKRYPRAAFVQIGSNDGAQQDPLREAIVGGHWSGVMVEPVPYVFERLRGNYGRYDGRIRLENVAIGSSDGSMPFYFIPRSEGVNAQGLPEWYDALGSFSREVIASHKPFIPDIESRIVCEDVPTLTFDSLCRRCGISRVDLLHIDTEGYDYEILKRVDLERWRPKLVIYEHHHLGAARGECEAYLRKHGYELMPEALDTWALRVADLGRGDRALLAMWRRLQAERSGGGSRRGSIRVDGIDPLFAPLFRFDDEERRLLSAAYDDRGPIPPGASVYLSSNNPRLIEIRERYARFDCPASVRSQWNKTRVDRSIDLCHFRGDNPYVWHYRELPRATRLKFYVYLQYVAGIDKPKLLEKLGEDGAFGCWSYDYAGHPRISRDLLESVNELLYLDRRIGLLQSRGLRVLDIGAGYGRMAHRMLQAVPAISDYCCVDAVPESSFLCEYYVRQRGLVPPARVVLLDEVSGLKEGAFDIALNIHSFSECPEAAVRWWLEQLVRLGVPRLFIVPNEPDGFLSTEPDGSKRDLMPVFAQAGYRVVHEEKVIADPAVRELLRIEDRFLIFERASP